MYIVADWCRKLVKSDSQLESLSDMRVVISIDDADSFDVSILSSLLKMLQSYISHIPVKLILSVATSVEVFEEKLPRSMIRLLDWTMSSTLVSTKSDNHFEKHYFQQIWCAEPATWAQVVQLLDPAPKTEFRKY